MVLPGGGADLGSARGSVRIDADTRGVDQAARALTGLETRTKSTKKRLDDFSLKAGLTGLGIAASIGVAAKSFISFEARMNAVRAVAGATEQEFEKLTQTAIRIGRDTAFSASEAAGAIEELAKAGVSVENILAGAADGATALAAAAGIGIPEAATFISNALNQFALAGDQANRVADVFANVANKSAASANDFGAALANTGTRAQALGIPIEQVAAAIAVMADQGLSGAEAGTALNQMLTELIAPSDQAKTAMEALGIVIEDESGEFVGLTSIIEQVARATAGMTKVQRESTLAQLFGQRGYRAIGALLNTQQDELKAVGKGWEDYTVAMEENGTAAAAADIRMAGISGALEELSGSLETAQIQFGEKLAPAIRLAAESLTSIVNAIGSLPGPLQSAIVFTAAGVAGFLLLAAAGAKVISVGISTANTWRQVSATLTGTTASSNAAAAGMTRLGNAAALAGGKAAVFGRGIGTAALAIASLSKLVGVAIIFDAITKNLEGPEAGASWADGIGTTVEHGIGSAFDAIGANSIGDWLKEDADETARDNALFKKVGDLGFEVQNSFVGGLQTRTGSAKIKGLGGITVRDIQELAAEMGVSFEDALVAKADELDITNDQIDAWKSAKQAQEGLTESTDATSAAMAGLTAEQYESGVAAGLSIEEMVALQEEEEAAAKAAEEFAAQLVEVTQSSLDMIRGVEDIAPGLDGMQAGFVDADASAEELILTMDRLGAVNLSDAARSALTLSENLNEVEADILRVEGAIENNQQDMSMWQGRINLVTDVLGGNTEALAELITQLQNGTISQEQFNAAIAGGALGPFEKLDALLAQGKISLEQYNEARSSGVWLLQRSAGALQDENAELVQNIIDLAAYAAAHDEADGAVKSLTDSQRQLIAATKQPTSQEFLNTLQLLKSVGADEEFIKQFIIDSSQADPVIRALAIDMGLLEEDKTVNLTWENANEVLNDIRGVTDAAVSLDGKKVTVSVDTDQTALQFAEANAAALDGKEVIFVIGADDSKVTVTLDELRAREAEEGLELPVRTVLPPNPDIGFTDLEGNAPDPVKITAEDGTGPAVDSAKENLATVPAAALEAGTETGDQFAVGMASSEANVDASVAGVQASVASGLQVVANSTFNYGFNAGYNFGVGFINGIAGFGPLAFNQGFNIAFNALVGAKAALGISSPSREAQLLSSNFGGTFIDALLAQRSDAARAGAEFMNSLSSSMQTSPALRSLETGGAVTPGLLGAAGRADAVPGVNNSSINIPISVEGVSDPELAANLVADKLYAVFSRLDAGGAVAG